MPCKRFFHRSPTEPAAQLHISPIDTPIIMLPITFPPGIHPIPGHRPVLPQTELNPDVRYQNSVIKQVCFHRHAKRPFLYRSYDGNGITDAQRITCMYIYRISDGIYRITIIAYFHHRRTKFRKMEFIQI